MATANNGKSGAGHNSAGSPAGVTPVSEAPYDIDAELAALLESETIAAETPECGAPSKDEQIPAARCDGSD